MYASYRKPGTVNFPFESFAQTLKKTTVVLCTVLLKLSHSDSSNFKTECVNSSPRSGESLNVFLSFDV